MDFANAEVRAQSELFSKWMRNGESDATRFKGISNRDFQFRAMGIGEATGGQKAVGSAFYAGLVSGMNRTNVIRQEATVVSTEHGAPLHVPVYDDSEVEAVVLPENAQTASADIPVNAVTLGAYTIHSKIVRVSLELFNDGGATFQRHAGELLGRRTGRLANKLFLSGTGVGEPTGLLASATTIDATGTDAITYGELVALRYGLDSTYQSNAKWLMSPTTLGVIRKIVDDNSQPVFKDELLLGRPVLLTEDMPAIEPESIPVAFGDLSAYFIREVDDVTAKRYVEKYSEYHQVGLAATVRTDGALCDSLAVNCLKMAEA